MGIRIIFIAGLLLWAPISGAADPSPEQTVELLLHTNHGINEMAGKEVLATWAEVQRNPKPYLPHLRARVSLERIDAATDKRQLQGIQNAVTFIVVLGENDDRALLVTLLKQLHQKRDEISASVKARGPGIASRPENEKESFRSQVRYMNRLIAVEGAILRSFSEVADLRLRDALLPRLDHDADMRDRYIGYFEATGREDPAVRTRLKKMLEAPLSPETEERLRRFFKE